MGVGINEDLDGSHGSIKPGNENPFEENSSEKEDSNKSKRQQLLNRLMLLHPDDNATDEQRKAYRFIKDFIDDSVPAYNIEEALKILREYSQYEGTEVGEMWSYAIALWDYIDYCNYEPLIKPLREFIIREASIAVKYYEFVTEERTITKTTKTLEYKG